LKKIITPSPAKCSSVPLVAGDELAERGVVRAEHVEEVLGSRRLSECGEVAKIAKEAGDIGTVAGKKLLTIGR
jgi:hypothetical protein